MEIFRFTVCSLGTEGCSQVPVKIIYCNGGQAGIDDLVKRRVELPGPVPDDCSLTASGRAGQEAEAFGFVR